MDISSAVAERPARRSPDFTYRPSGDIIARQRLSQASGGHADFTAYSQIRFPLEKAPAFANSQSFLKRRAQSSKIATSRQAAMPAIPGRTIFARPAVSASANAPAASAIRARTSGRRTCPLRKHGGDRCDPKQQAVVAVRDGVVIRSPKQQAATLQVNSRTEHIRFRYMHMNPPSMDADGVLNGRRVAEGEKIGVVSNYQDYPNGTSHHLHFDVQVFTRDGWLWVNPYVTLIASYERLIRGRGREIGTAAPRLPPPWRMRCRRMCCVARRAGRQRELIPTKPPRLRRRFRAGGVQR